MKTDNNTLNGIKNDAERSLLISWSLIVLLSSLIGDTIILIATIKYKAIILHKVIITVMQPMSVCDLIQTVFRVFPEHVALITDVWMMGELLCHVSYNISWVCNPVAVFMTSALTTLKLIVVKYPLRTGAWSTWLGHKVCSSVWLLVLGFYIPLLVAWGTYSTSETQYTSATKNMPVTMTTSHLVYQLGLHGTFLPVWLF